MDVRCRGQHTRQLCGSFSRLQTAYSPISPRKPHDCHSEEREVGEDGGGTFGAEYGLPVGMALDGATKNLDAQW